MCWRPALDFSPQEAILKHVLNNQPRRDGGQPNLDSIFHALADSTRRGIVVRLCRGPASVSELAEPFAMSLPAIVQHLQVLESSGLVRTEKIGRVRSCSIVPATVRGAEHWLAERRTKEERLLDRLDVFLNMPGDDSPGSAATGTPPE